MATRPLKQTVYGILLAAVLIALSATGGLAASYFPVLSNGPSSNRIDIALLSEGYTSNQLAKFLGDSTNALNGILSRSPFQEYRGHLNAGAIWVASAQAGSDHPAYGLTRNTYFSSTYDLASDYIITIPAGAQGQGKADALLATHMPDYDLAVLLVNDPVFGGSDGNGNMAIASTAPASAVIVAHEAGHVLGGLGDEYERPYPGFPDIEFPNTTRETRRDFIRWKAWIEEATPLPTPETFDHYDTVGLFEGAHYHETGWFRPKLDCAMNSMQPPFCEVCREALVLAFYGKCRPIDSFHPTNRHVAISEPAPVDFGLTLLQPMTDSLRVEWRVNGILVSSGSNTQFVCDAASLQPGENSVSAIVRDETAFVRNDPTALLQQSISWVIEVQQAGPLLLQAPHLPYPGKFAFRVDAASAMSVKVQTSTNFTEWVTISTNNVAPGGSWITNDIPGADRSFYRVLR